MRKIIAASLACLLCSSVAFGTDAPGFTAGFSRDDTKNVVTDSVYKLMWQDDEQIFIGDWAQAKEYCERLKFAGFDDWRLPTIDELISITDKSKFNPAINPAFKNVRLDLYWSATKDAVSASNAWVAVFKNGEDGWVEARDKNFARCVRSEK